MPQPYLLRGRIFRWLIVCTFVVCLAKLASGPTAPTRVSNSAEAAANR